MADAATRTGQCMCGALKFTARPMADHAACYCKMCQRWASGMFVGIRSEDFTITSGEAHLKVFDSSPWASRGFCSTCGSNIFYALKEAPHKSVALGAFDDADGLNVARVFYADMRPDTLDLGADCNMLSAKDVEQMFGGS